MIIELSQSTGGNMESRYMANGKRISKEKYDTMSHYAKRKDCFHTIAKQMPGKIFRLTNYMTIDIIRIIL